MRPFYARIYEQLPIAMQSVACTIDGYRRYRSSYSPHFERTLAAWEKSIDDSEERCYES